MRYAEYLISSGLGFYTHFLLVSSNPIERQPMLGKDIQYLCSKILSFKQLMVERPILAGYFIGLFLSPWFMIAACNKIGFEQCDGVPKESSFFTFSVRKNLENSGNCGDLWVMAEDFTSYYIRDEELSGYYVIPKSNNCPNFNPDDLTTWCEEKRKGLGERRGLDS